MLYEVKGDEPEPVPIDNNIEDPEDEEEEDPEEFIMSDSDD